MTADAHKSGFQWPPRQPPQSHAVSTGSGTVRNETHAAGRPLGLWSRIEREWLDPVALPLDRRAAEAGWLPDAPVRYCDRCGHDIGAYEAGEFGCAACARQRLPWQRFIRLGAYRPPLSDWICEVKFTRWRVLGLQLGRLLGKHIRDAGWLENASTRRFVIVPVPTTFRRRLSRGIDHAAIIASGASIELGIPLIKALRRRHRPSQRAVPASERVRNVAGCFRCADPRAISDRHVILIDDVMTSGATLRGAARALSSTGGGIRTDCTVYVGVIAVTPEGDER